MRRIALAAGLVLLAPAVLAGTAVDINKADAATLAQSLDGIGPSRSRAIVAWREAHGPFRSADDLTAIKGIGKVVVEKNRAFIKVGAPASQGGSNGG